MFKEVPFLSTYHYRIKRLPKRLFQKAIFLTFKKIFKNSSSVKLWIADGTGYSYRDIYPMKFFRGKVIKNITSQREGCCHNINF